MLKPLTKSEKIILSKLDAAPDKIMHYSKLRREAGLSMQGFMLVERRMNERNLLARSPGNYANVVLTFGGMRALGAAK